MEFPKLSDNSNQEALGAKSNAVDAILPAQYYQSVKDTQNINF